MAEALVGRLERRLPGGPIVTAELALDPSDGLVTVLLGPSGAGKTTLLRLLAGLDRPDDGHLRMGGETWFDAASGTFVPARRRRVGLLFQDHALFPHLTVGANLAFGLSDLPRVERDRRVGELLELVRLPGHLSRLPTELSGGEAQRVALARALARRPRLLLLDEPLSALDVPARLELREELRLLLRRLGVPAVLVTHDRTEAMALGDRLAVMVGGRVRQVGAVASVFARPLDAEVARFVGVDSVLPARVVSRESGVVRLDVSGVAVSAWAADGEPVSSSVLACVRAEEVLVERGAPERSSARNHLSARVAALTPEGPLVRVTLDCGFPLAALVTRAALEDLDLREGERVTAVFKAGAVHLVPR